MNFLMQAMPGCAVGGRVLRRLQVMTALALVFAAPLMMAPSEGLAQAVVGGTLGIDCDKPRRNADGKLIFGDDGSQRALCEADRTTALTYARVVRETRDRLRAALAVLPPPVWDDLVDHLRTNDDIENWAYSDAAMMTRISTLSASAPPGNPNENATADRAHGLAQHWQNGILAGSGVTADWHPALSARACGFGAAGEILPGAMILVWLDPAAVRDRWTPAMVQRTARTWLESQSDQFVAVDRIPGFVTAARQLSRADGSVQAISGDPAIQACFATVPDGALAMRITLWRSMDTGSRMVGCAGANQVGLRRFVWARQNGVFIVPENAVQADGSDHPDRGEPLLGQSAGLPLAATEADAEFLVQTTCRAPRTLDAVRAVDCDAEINGQTVQGAHVRSFRFREVQNDPVDPLRIDMVPVGPDPLDPANALGVIAPAGDPHPVWSQTTLFCDGELPVIEAPPIPPRTPATWPVPDCSAQWGGRFDEGTRTGYSQIIRYPPDWPVDVVEVRTIDDDCFNPVAASGQERRPGPDCPVGHVGAITEGRDFSWWNRDWAVPSRHGSAGDRSVGGAAASYDANPSQAGLAWYDVVTLVTDWRVVANTCQEPSDDDDDGGGNANNHRDRNAGPPRGHPAGRDAGVNDGHSIFGNPPPPRT